ncbi:MAG: hypothetical protein IPO13_11925 [Rhodocyclaceae bacterium]|nr:hypothetical protein [Rhodocyclaceae bacterium]
MFPLHHLFGIVFVDETAAHKGAQDALAGAGLHGLNSQRIELMRGMETDARHIIGNAVVRVDGWLKHPIHHAAMKMHVRVERRAKAMDEGDGPDACGAGVCVGCAGTLHAQRALHFAQKIRSTAPCSAASVCRK